MKMPGTGTCHIRKQRRQLWYVLVYLLLSALVVSAVFADVPVTPPCNLLDESGNPICPGPGSAVQSNMTGQGNYSGITRYFSGLKGSLGQLKDLYPAIINNTEELITISGSGITRSINQTLHQEDYPSLTDREPEELEDTISEVDDDAPPPSILRSSYAYLVRGVLQFIDITSRGVRGSVRNVSTENKSIWTNRSADDLIGSPLYGPDPDERFIPKLEAPVARVIKNVTKEITSLLATKPTPFPEINSTPVPTPTPVPVPVFNLSVNSEPSGALIVLNGNRTGMTPFVITGLEKNTYTLNLTRAGYLAYGEIVTLDTNKTLEISLTPTLNAMFVTPGKSTAQNRYGGMYLTTYPDKLELSIDGVAVQTGTPFLYYGFAEGIHTVKVLRTDKSSGPVTYTRSVWVYHDALTTYHIDTEEVLMSKRVSIRAGPYSGAEFTVNGIFPAGSLPSTITAGCPGSFIGVHKGDTYTSFLIPCTNQETVTMTLTDTNEPHPPVLVSSSPDGAEIFIDGFRTGYTTPHTFNEISGGLHRVMVSKPGLYPKDEIITVEIRSGNTTPQKVFFPMENYGEGTIVVDSLPPGASIFLNGWSPGEGTPHTFDHMKIGFYEVIVQMGATPWIEQIELTPSKVSKIVGNFRI